MAYLTPCHPVRYRVVVTRRYTPPCRVYAAELLNVELHERKSAAFSVPSSDVALADVEERYLVRRFVEVFERRRLVE